jgi:putative transcriptional regulator
MVLGERRIKIADVARDAGIGRAVLDRWYHDKVSSYDRDVLSRLCDYLKVTPSDLLQVVEQGKLF